MPKLCAINVSGGGHKHGRFFQNYKADLGQMHILVSMDVSQLQEKTWAPKLKRWKNNSFQQKCPDFVHQSLC